MSKNSIIERIKKYKPDIQPLPETLVFENIKSDLVEEFKVRLLQIGGQIFIIEHKYLNDHLKEYFGHFKNITSNDKSLEIDTVSFGDIDNLNQLNSLELVVLKCDLGVVENASVWISAANVSQRVLPFIAENVVLIVNENDLVGNLQEAYNRISFEVINGFGVFISGPSKTADIEQSLVIGAHGAKSLSVYIVK